MSDENVDRRLLGRFEASLEHERARRQLLPPVWINAEPGPEPGERLATVFDDVLERARERVRAQREALDARVRDNGLDPAI